MTYTDVELKETLERAGVVAVVGLSANPGRPSHFVARYLKDAGYRVIGVNPGLAGQEMMSAPVYPDLASIPDEVDMIDVFRRSDAVPALTAEALERWPGLQTVWLQIGVVSPEAARMAEARGVRMIQDRCTKVEHRRLIG